MVKLAHNSIRSGIMTEKRLELTMNENEVAQYKIIDLLNKNEQGTIKHWLNDYIQDHTIKVDKLPLYGNDNLIYQLPNKLEYIYFEKKWECIGEVEELNNERKEKCGMTEKRFTFDEDVNEDDMYEMGVFSDNGKVMETIDVLTCLNNFHDENEQLKQQLIEKERMLDVRDKIIKDVMKAVNGDVE